MSNLGIWIIVATALFVVGNVMALKPSGVEQRLDKLRMTARRLNLNPKLIQTPKWMRGADNGIDDGSYSSYGKGMIAQYALLLPDKKLPELYYQVIDGKLRPLSIKASSPLNDTYNPNKTILYKLDKTPLDLPETIAPFVKAIYVKANNIVVFWDDSSYVKPKTNPNYDPQDIEPDLLRLKEQLQLWATILES